MEFQQLRYFVSAAECLSVSRAAEQLNVSQPAVSRQIQLLESELGVLLFERVRKRMQLTGAGRMFLGRARRVLREAEASAKAIREKFGRERTVLRIGFIAMLMDDLVVPSVNRFLRRMEGVDVKLVDLYPRPMLRMLREDEIDVALTAEPVEGEAPGVVGVSVWQHRIAVVLPERHRLAKRASVRMTELRRETWITLSERTVSVRHRALEDMFAVAGFEPESVVEVDSWQTLLAAVATGQGVTMLPDHASKLAHAGCCFVPISVPDIRLDLRVFRRVGDERPEVMTLSNILRARASELSESRGYD
jgi:DNA-binding transcriptional LysR family regulator